MATFREIIEAPRWAGLETIIRDLAWEYDLALSLDVEKRLLKATFRLRVDGDDGKVASFSRRLYASLDDYQHRVDQIVRPKKC